MSIYLDDIIDAKPSKKRVLLTGAGGSIGIHFMARFLEAHPDWEIVGVDSFRHRGWCDRVAEHLKNHPSHIDRVTMVTHDLTAPFSDLTKKQIGHIDYIISMASLSDVETSIQEPVPFFMNNVALVLNLLEYAREIKPEVFLQISTDEVYGPTTGKNEGYKEWDAQIPSNPYAASKSAQEMACIAWWRAYGVPVIITNTMNNFAEMQSPSKYPVMIQKALANGDKIQIHHIAGEIGSRSYIHSGNFAMAVLFLLDNTKPHLHIPGAVDKPDRYHIAGEQQVDNLELAQKISKIMGKEDFEYEMVDVHSTRPGHDPHYGLDDSKIRGLGFKAPHTFDESLENTVKWQMEHPEWIN